MRTRAEKLELAVRHTIGPYKMRQVWFADWLALRCAGLHECCPSQEGWRLVADIRAQFGWLL